MIARVCAPSALVVAGMSIDTGPTGAVGAPPVAGKVNVVLGSGAAAVPLIGAPLAVTNTFQVSVAALLEVVGQRHVLAEHVEHLIDVALL